MYFNIQRLKELALIAKSAKDKELAHYASSLSFHTVTAIIPILLLSFSIFTKLPSFDVYYSKIKEFIYTSLLPSHQDVISDYVERFLSNSFSVGVIGFVAMVFTSVMFFVDYQYVINKIMKTRKSRGFWASLSAYWTLITLAPLGLALSFYLSNLIQNALSSNSYTSWINFISIFPYLVIWCIFFATYLISVSEKVRAKYAAVGSFFASLAWYLGKSAFVKYATSNDTYTSVYGSFSILFFFLIWVHISWVIFLYGLKICSYLHNKEILKLQSQNKDEI